MGSTSGPVTQLLEAASRGEAKAAAELLPLVYSELRNLARILMAKVPPGNTLQPTALVHEAYLRLVGEEDPGWKGRGHFFGAAAQAMRQILVEQARRKARRKHGGGQQRVDLDDVHLSVEPTCPDILALDEALSGLEADDPRAAQVVMLRFFAGLTIEEIAAVTELSVSTIEREWRFARAFLHSQLADVDRAT
jgi:RNA polymerase sigma factor (TIGR02999 family)